MKVDPAIVQIHAENVRAEVIDRTPTLKLDPAILQKIKQKVPIFSGMTPECLMSTLAVAEYFPVKAGEVVFNERDIGDSFFVLIAGEVVVEKVSNGKKAELARLSAGNCFGEMALVGNHLRSATVRAVDDVVTMRFYRELVDSNPESAHIIYRNIASILAARLDESSVMLADLVVQKSPG
ncbi:cyclic nucleotide-binding domain-containing protein [Rhodoferax sp.]|uniref:cyclic nucleotide-binding domain-containing protein n=1 Tax=Rhodoferax sp. TaxID=50421 RepID=UPI001ED284B2|nr:cyclic nucleotide-binding domain-containing protein [Rhodoferax sp.]MBT9507612.1 cyclic nucleotide-binding domain-containing protein [Rhodoferax sp.]